MVELDNVARFHVFLTWTDRSAVKFQRINVISVEEKVSRYDLHERARPDLVQATEAKLSDLRLYPVAGY